MTGLGCTAGRRPAPNSNFAPAPPRNGPKNGRPGARMRIRVEMLLGFSASLGIFILLWFFAAYSVLGFLLLFILFFDLKYKCFLNMNILYLNIFTI
jgi:hypothetical protein